MTNFRSREAKRFKTTISVLIALVLTMTSSRAVAEQTVDGYVPEPAGSNTVDPFVGSFHTDYPITAPAFRGLEPKLALGYHSSAKLDIAGFGWTLKGMSFIERKAPRKGAPRYDATDVFMLDDDELIPCTTLGGTHCEKRQQFDRIHYENATDTWRVTETNGTVWTYAFRHATPSGTWRWYVTSVVDPRGNTVRWTYNPYYGGQSYPRFVHPDTVSYNGTVIKFYFEARSDVVRKGIGGGAVAEIHYRLKSIDVRVGGTRARAYAISYAQNPVSRLSRLASIRQFGKDASVDSNGTVSGGTPLPPQTYGYHDGPRSWASSSSWSAAGAPSRSYSNSDAFGSGGKVATARLIDVNGDGLADRVSNQMGLGLDSDGVALNTGNGFVSAPGFGVFPIETTQSECGFPGTPCQHYTTHSFLDVTRDGRPDQIRQDAQGRFWVRANNGAGFNAEQSWSGPTNVRLGEAEAASVISKVIDMNGDGLADLVGRGAVYLNTGNGFQTNGLAWGFGAHPDSTYVEQWWVECTAPDASGHSGCNSWAQTALVDLNGDGLPDRVTNHAAPSGPAGPTGTWSVRLNTGTGFSANAITWTVPIPYPSAPGRSESAKTESVQGSETIQTRLLDMDGDGLVDLFNDGQVYLNTGSGFTSTNIPTGSLSVEYSFGPCSPSNCSTDAFVTTADLNGDGLLDRIVASTSSPGAWSVSLAAGYPVANVMTSATNELGGRIAVTYSPSSRWSPTLLPNVQHVVSAMTRSDGRGGVVAMTYQYEGGLWSAAEARFLGFRTAKEIDATGAYTETLFTQSVADPNSTPIEKRTKTNTGALVKYRAFSYARSGDGVTSPYVSFPSEEWEYECNGNSTCKRALTTLGYDAYGNVTRRIEHGDYDVAGDERTIDTTFYVNTNRYLVSFPSAERIYEGNGSTGPQVQDNRKAYDGLTVGEAPVRGDLTHVAKYLSPVPSSADPRFWTQGRYIATTRYQHDVYGNVIRETDALGRQTNRSYDAIFNLFEVTTTNALGQRTSRVWDPTCAGPTSTTDPNGQLTTTQYDALCRPIRENRPDGSYSRIAYESFGMPTSQAVSVAISDGTADDLWSRAMFDGLGRVYRTVTEGDRIEDIEYEGRGLELRRSVPHATGEGPAWVTKEFDAARRLTRTTHPDGTSQTCVYDDWKKTTKDELGKSIDHLFDGYQRLRRTVEHNGGTTPTTDVTYDLLGRLTRVRDAAGNVTTLGYDTLGRKTALTDPDMGPWTYRYDDAGNLIEQTDARGVTLATSYDALDRVLTRKHGSLVLVSFTYDQPRSGFFNVGQITTMTDPSGSSARDYDKHGRLLREQKVIGARSFTLRHSYDLADRPATTTYPDGEIVTYGYNNAGDTVRVGPYVTAATYNARKEVVTRAFGNGVVQSFTYHPTRFWLTGSTTKNSGAAVLDQASYTWDARGEIIQKGSSVTTPDNWQYGYDDLRRLIQATNVNDSSLSQSFTYNAIGNLISQTGVGSYTYPAAGQARPHAPLTAGNRTFSYDQNGNRLSDGEHASTYDAENKLATFDGTAYQYDGEGKRVRVGATMYLDKFVEETFGCATKYYFEGELRVARKDCDGKVYYYHAGIARSARKMTDASGQLVRSTVLSPFGRNVTNCTVPFACAVNDPFGLGGERMDASGLYHLGARYMDPRAGQFTQPDPSGDPDPRSPQKLNRYSYAYNNPIRIIDPTGYEGADAAASDSASTAASAPGTGDAAYTGDYSEFGATSTNYGAFGEAPGEAPAAPATTAPATPSVDVAAIGSEWGETTVDVNAIGSEWGTTTEAPAEPATPSVDVAAIGSEWGTTTEGPTDYTLTVEGLHQPPEEKGVKDPTAIIETLILVIPAVQAPKTAITVINTITKYVVPQITFKTAHGSRHYAHTNLNPAEVNKAIAEQVGKQIGKFHSIVRGDFRGRISVRGHQLEYRGHGRDNGTINIGTTTYGWR
jgi:RHS repeat-associated protein